jgi:hypothetical protein
MDPQHRFFRPLPLITPFSFNCNQFKYPRSLKAFEFFKSIKVEAHLLQDKRLKVGWSNKDTSHGIHHPGGTARDGRRRQTVGPSNESGSQGGPVGKRETTVPIVGQQLQYFLLNWQQGI